MTEHFDAEYYRRFYEDRETSIITPEMRRNEIAFVIAFCRHIGLEVKRFADVGAGTGWWAREFSAQYPSTPEIETYDASQAACTLYGHKRLQLEKLSGKPAELVICRDVLRYLNNRSAEEGIRRLAKKCRGVLYIHLVTSEDEFDEEASDVQGYFRSVSWYRMRLRREGFRDCGMGLFVSNRFTDFSPWAIETL